jgi:hypothetical protein
VKPPPDVDEVSYRACFEKISELASEKWSSWDHRRDTWVPVMWPKADTEPDMPYVGTINTCPDRMSGKDSSGEFKYGYSLRAIMKRRPQNTKNTDQTENDTDNQ